MMKRSVNYKKKLARAMYIISFALIFFSVIVLTMAYSVSSIKKMFGEGGTASLSAAEFKPSPELTALISINSQFPDEMIKLKKQLSLRERFPFITKITKNDIYRDAISSIEFYNGSRTDPDYCRKLWAMNGPARYEISLIASGNFKWAKPLAKTPSYFESYNLGYEKANFSAVMMALAIENGDLSFALDAADAHLLYSKTLADCFMPATVPVRLNYLMPLIAEHKNTMNRLFLAENACFHTSETIMKLAAALEKRVRFIDALPTFIDALKNECLIIKKAAANLPLREKITLGMMDLWYGDANEPYYELVRNIESSGKTDFASIADMTLAIYKKYPRRNSFSRELAYSEEGIIPMLKFAWFAINTHPMATSSFARIPSHMLFTVSISDAYFRLATLGGLARCFYYENGRWPDLSKDLEFTKKAGRSAVDPYTEKPMRVKHLADGSLSFYCHWKDGINSPAESKTTEIEVTAVMPDVLKKQELIRPLKILK